MTRSRPPEDIRKRREKHPSTPPKEHISWDWKFWIGTGVLGVLALLIGILGIWLSIEDRPTLSLGTPADPNDVLNTPAQVVNNGVLPIVNVSLECFIKHSEMGDGSGLNYALGVNFRPPTGTLRPGEPLSIDLRRMIGMTPRFHALDMAIVANFSPTWAPFWHRRRLFRMELNQHTHLLEQVPAEDIEEDYQKINGGHSLSGQSTIFIP